MSSNLTDTVRRLIEAAGSRDGFLPTAIDTLTLMRSTRESDLHHRLYRPALCLVLQGAKEVMLEREIFEYRERQALVVALDMPLLGRVSRASRERPYLGLMLEFDVEAMRGVLERLEAPPLPGAEPRLGVFVADVEGALLDALARLVRLLETPRAIPVLYPGILSEILFWLLAGPHGGEIAKLALPDGHTQRIGQAIRILRESYARPIRIEALAAAAGMSLSSFHLHFKALTALTPLQYQKQLRLLEARRLMLVEGVDAASAAYGVGYESASQFSREYARLFGAPPRRDVELLRRLQADGAAQPNAAA